MKRTQKLQNHLFIGLAIVAGFALLPMLTDERFFLGQVILFFIWAIVAMSWNLLAGHSGVFSLAQLLFVACGAYGVAMGVTYFGLPIWVAIPAATLLAVVVALIIGLACLRLSGVYIALLTLAIAQIVHSLILSDTSCLDGSGVSCVPVSGGTRGISGFDGFGFKPILRGNWILGNYYVILGAFAAVIFAIVVVIHGRLGLAFRAIRDNVGYASSRGVDRKRYQLLAFVVSAFFTGLAGGLYAAHFQFAGPSIFEFSNVLFVLAMMVVGGMGSTWGPLIGTALIMVLTEIATGYGDAKHLLLGAALIVTVILMPNGLAKVIDDTFTRLRGVVRPKTIGKEVRN